MLVSQARPTCGSGSGLRDYTHVHKSNTFILAGLINSRQIYFYVTHLATWSVLSSPLDCNWSPRTLALALYLFSHVIGNLVLTALYCTALHMRALHSVLIEYLGARRGLYKPKSHWSYCVTENASATTTATNMWVTLLQRWRLRWVRSQQYFGARIWSHVWACLQARFSAKCSCSC